MAGAGDEGAEPLEQDFRLLTELAQGFMVSQVLFTALELGVFDALDPAPRGVAWVCQALELSPHGARLLLDTCTALGLLRVEEAGGDGVYALTRVSCELLSARSPRAQRSMLRYLGGTTRALWARLGGAIRDGRNQYPEALGVATRDPFAAIYRSEPERLLFMSGLQETWSLWAGPVLTTFDLSEFREVCDVGGGSGALAAALARLHPGSSVTVFDTPEVVAAAQQHFRVPGAGPPVRFVGGDFFRSPLPPADLYVLARVLHDWDDDACARLLGRAGRGSALLLVEAVLSPGGRGPLPALLTSLTMLAQAAGREREESEFRALTAAAGFPDLTLRRPGGAVRRHARPEVTSQRTGAGPGRGIKV